MMRVSVFALMLVLAGWARADDCSALRAFNAQQPSRAAMKPMPCHCIPRSERMDKVYKNCMPKIERPADAVAASAAILSEGALTPGEFEHHQKNVTYENAACLPSDQT
jgi:hypothetical protein